MKFRRTFTPHPRKKEKQKKVLKNKIILSIVAFIVFIAFLSFVSHNKNLAIDTISVEGNKVLVSEDILEIVNAELSGRYFFLFPKNNIFIYPQKKIEKDLLETYRRIKSVQISFENLKKLKSITVSITERRGEYLWCGMALTHSRTNADLSAQVDLTQTSTEEKCYFVDEKGFIFAEAPYFSGNIFFRFYGLGLVSSKTYQPAPKLRRAGADLTQTNADNEIIGRFIMDPAEFERIILFKGFLRDIGIDSQVLITKEEGNYEFLFGSGEITEFSKLIFNKEDDFERLLNNLASALEIEPLATKFRENFSSLLYIDLRFNNKVIYKFKES